MRWSLALWLGLVLCSGCSDPAREKLERALMGRGRIVVFGNDGLLQLDVPAAALIGSATLPRVDKALRGTDDNEACAALAESHIDALLVDTHAATGLAKSSIVAQLAQYGDVNGFTGIYLSPTAVLYGPDSMRSWSRELRDGIAEVARRLLAGAAEPRMMSFPDQLRHVEPVEVMVLLRSGESPRLWRSARGSSFARALVSAAQVARQRWIERQTAMGASIDASLPKLDVEVDVLRDDGEIGVRNRAFIDHVVSPLHGVAYEHKGAWRYLLPVDTHKDQTPSAAYLRLLGQDGLGASALDRDELRLYRMSVQPVGVSAAPALHDPSAHDAISDVASPSEVLGK